MGLCVLYYVEYSLYSVKKVGFFLSGLELHFNNDFWVLINSDPSNKLFIEWALVLPINSRLLVNADLIGLTEDAAHFLRFY